MWQPIRSLRIRVALICEHAKAAAQADRRDTEFCRWPADQLIANAPEKSSRRMNTTYAGPLP